MDRYYSEDLVVPTYHETSDSYPSPHDMWDEWSMNSQKAAEKCFDFDVINNGFSGGLYNHTELEEEEEEEEESKRLKKDGDCFFNSVSSLHEFDGIQHMDDMFLNSILEDVPGNVNLHSFHDTIDARQVPMFHHNLDTTYHDMPLMGEEDNMEEPSTEEVVLQNLQRATEKLTDDTRKCFRDTFYRLAKNSQQNLGSDNNNNNNLEEFLDDRTRNRDQKNELETNSMDRAVANLTFNNMESNMRNLPSPNRVSSIQG